jgi:hypothetical protein
MLKRALVLAFALILIGALAAPRSDAGGTRAEVAELARWHSDVEIAVEVSVRCSSALGVGLAQIDVSQSSTLGSGSAAHDVTCDGREHRFGTAVQVNGGLWQLGLATVTVTVCTPTCAVATVGRTTLKI